MIDESCVTFKPYNVDVDISHGPSYGRTNVDMFDYLKQEKNCFVAIDIDSENMRILVREGKENKYRYTLLSQKNLEILREYFKAYRPNHPEGYLFVSPMTNAKYGSSGPEIAFRRIKKKAGITRKVTVHRITT